MSKGGMYLQRLVFWVSMLFPISFLAPRGLGASFYLLLACSLAGIALRLRPMGKSFVQVLQEFWPVHLSMTGLFLATLSNQLSSGQFTGRALELPFLFACFPLLLWILMLSSDMVQRWIPWGLAAGAVTCSLVLYIATIGGTIRPLGIYRFPLIPFGNIAMLLGVLVLFSIGWNSRDEKLAIGLKILGGSAGLYGAYLSQARGGWVAIPVFVVLALYIFRSIHICYRLAFLVFLMVILGGTYLGSETIRERINAGRSDIQQFLDGSNKDTSLGQRFQLWRGGWLLFKESPIVGISRDQYPTAVKELVALQEMTPIAASQPHSHNDILFQSVTLGLFGFAAIVSLYVVPTCYFAKQTRSRDWINRIIAGMGMAVTLGFFIFGLSDTMFFWRVNIMFYVILLALLFACLESRKVRQ